MLCLWSFSVILAMVSCWVRQLDLQFAWRRFDTLPITFLSSEVTSGEFCRVVKLLLTQRDMLSDLTKTDRDPKPTSVSVSKWFILGDVHMYKNDLFFLALCPSTYSHRNAQTGCSSYSRPIGVADVHYKWQKGDGLLVCWAYRTVQNVTLMNKVKILLILSDLMR